MQKRRKIFYSSGLISLILLPLLGIHYFTGHRGVDPVYTMEVTFPEKRDMALLLKSIPENTNRITLLGDRDDKVKLEYAQLAIHELMLNPNKMLGIEFNLEGHTKYWALVKLFNICKIENVRTYFNYQDTFWVFNFTPKTTEEAHAVKPFCSTSCYVHDIHKGEIFMEEPAERYAEAVNLLKRFWFPAILFMVMIGLTVWRIHFLTLRTGRTSSIPLGSTRNIKQLKL